MLDIHQLHVFVLAAETLNFTQAAQRLHMTQPSVSQHIHALERQFDIPLFIRSGRNLELTDAGLALLPLAREAVHLSMRIEENLASLKGDVYGHLIVGCSTTPGKYVLPMILARFHDRYPKVRATCQVTPQTQALQMLANGSAHFALTSLYEEPHPDTEFRSFLFDRVKLIAPLQHPWARTEVINPEDLIKANFILREDTSGTFIAVREALARLGIPMEDLHTILTLGNAEAITLAVQEGIGVGFVSEMVVERIGSGRVAPVQVRGLEIIREIHLGRHIRRPATTAQKAFWDFVFSPDNPLIQVRSDQENLVLLN